MNALIVLAVVIAAIALLFVGAAIQGYIRRERLWREPQWFDKDDSYWLGEDWSNPRSDPVGDVLDYMDAITPKEYKRKR